MPQAQGKVTPRRVWSKEFVGGILFLGLVVVIGMIIKLQSHQASKTTTSASKISATPDSYNDCIGTVTAVNANIVSIEFKGTARSGAPFTKIFNVTVRTTTDTQTLSTVKNQRVLSPAQLSDIKIGQTVFIAAAENIAAITDFTATKFYIYSLAS